MSWLDRLQPELIMVSPEGDSFTALWSGDPRDKAKKLGIFEYPGLVGATIQDLQIGASFDKLSFFFEGPDHDEEGEKFYKATDQSGAWTISHPTLGQVEWQLMTVKKEMRPVDDANATAFKTEWVSSIGGEIEVSATQVAAETRAQELLVNSKANDQAAALAKVIKPSDITSFKTAIREASNAVKTTLAPLTSASAEINAQVESVYRSISESLASSVFSVASLAGQVQVMVGLPSQILGDLVANLSYYSDLLGSTVTLTDSAQADTTVNAAVVREVVAVTCLSAIAEIVVNNPPTTRAEALSALTEIAAAFNATLTGLDASQTSLDGEYTSQSESFNDTALLLAGVSDLLLKRSFDLATAKIIQLNRHRTPTEIAMTEDVDLDLFIATNGLKGTEILLLEPGREVVVYA